jgi:hypothetical protein
MASIRTYDGEIGICTTCGQPAFFEETECGKGWEHFDEQWDGVFCPDYPMAASAIPIGWDPDSLESLKERYPNTNPDWQRRRSRARLSE